MPAYTTPTNVSAGTADPAKYNAETADNLQNLYDRLAALDAESTVRGVSVATSQTTGSATYVDLTTVGPVVGMVTGTSVLVTLAARIASPGGISFGLATMSVAISGATTVAAGTCILQGPRSSAAFEFSRTFLISGLTAGLNVFTAKYAQINGSSGTSTFSNRSIIVETVP